MERQMMEVDIACVGFGPATAGFLHTLSKAIMNEDGTVALESRIMPGAPLQVMCYERADDISFGVSGVVTRGKALRESFPELNVSEIPTAAEVTHEEVLYLTDPDGASTRSAGVKMVDKVAGLLAKDNAFALPWIPPFLRKEPGMVFSMGQFCQWIGQQLMGSGLVQIWPGMPVDSPLIEDDKVVGIRLADQGVEKDGSPTPGYMPGMDLKAGLTVVGDGPVGAVGQKLDDHFGLPEGNHIDEWAAGMKAVVQLPEDTELKPGFVLHTFGYPEPEIFGYMYVLPDNVASLGIFVPSWLDNPIRSSFRMLQHWMQHPAVWKYLEGSTLKSWGAKSLQESGMRGEPKLVGDGFARVGEGSGTTNVLTGSGFDEAWATGVQLAEATIELLKEGKSFSQFHLEETYLKRRRSSWVEEEAQQAKKARDGFTRGLIPGLIGMGMTGMTKGKLNMPGTPRRPWDRVPSFADYFRGKLEAGEVKAIVDECKAKGQSMVDPLMDKMGWKPIPYDGQLLLLHQDALLLGGKVQAAHGFADHVRFADPEKCRACESQICISMCSGQAIAASEGGDVPNFDREKCVHCGICMWNCTVGRKGDEGRRSNIIFDAGSGGFHSAEN